MYCIQHDTDPSFVASLYKAVGDTLCVVGGPGSLAFTPELTGGLIDGTKLHLQNMAEKRKRRAASAGVGAQGSGNGAGGSAHALPPLHAPSSNTQPAPDEDDRDKMALMEEMEEFALEDMERTLRLIGGQDALLIAIGSVRELGFCRERYSEWGGSDGE